MRSANQIFYQMAAIAALLLSASSAPAQDERRGERLLSRNCAMCHAIGRSGRSPHRKAPPFRTLSTRYPIEDLAEEKASSPVIRTCQNSSSRHAMSEQSCRT